MTPGAQIERQGRNAQPEEGHARARVAVHAAPHNCRRCCANSAP